MKIPITTNDSFGKFSVISITKGDFIGLSKTIDSMLMQKYIDWEMIIVVGSDSDSSFKYAREKSQTDQRFIVTHQNTDGIYPAMNQGISLVTGNYLWFMNSGDCFHNENSLKEVAKIMGENEYSMLLGGYELFDVDGKNYSFKNLYVSARRFSLNIRSGCHQSTIYRVDRPDNIPMFRTDLKIASDFDWILRQIIDKSCYRIKQTLAIIEPGGISDTGIRQVISEKQKIREDVFGRYSIDAFLGHLWSIGVLTKIYSRRFLVYLRTIFTINFWASGL